MLMILVYLVLFYRHKQWAGTAWTWGEQTGDRGWSVPDLEEADAWHGRPTGDTADVWSLRLNVGGILLQCPKVITSGIAGICRVAWLPEAKEEDGGTGIDSKLLRMEASVLALEPIIDEEQDAMLGFYPPVLGSLRCDTFAKTGELENTSMLEKLRNMGELDDGNMMTSSLSPEVDSLDLSASEAIPKAAPQEKKAISPKNNKEEDVDMDDLRNALKL